MTRRATTALLLLAALLFACGKYGSPLRPATVGAAVSQTGVVLDHADSCEDPEHDHGAEPDADPHADPAEPAEGAEGAAP